MLLPPSVAKARESVRASLWVRPVAWIGAGVVLGILMPVLDLEWQAFKAIARTPWLSRWGDATPTGTREMMLAAITALATIVAVAFSLTMITVQLASTQYTSRLLRHFMADRTTQRILGAFLATIAYLLLALRGFRDPTDNDPGFVPFVSLLVGMAFALGCLALLAVFLHHTARSVQVSTIIAQLGRATLEGVDAIDIEPDKTVEDFDFAAGGAPEVIRAQRVGYVQLLDEDRLMKALPREVRLARLDAQPGDFMYPGEPLVSVWPAVKLSPRCQMHIRHAFATGRERTTQQDVLFGVRQIVDVGMKALSPAINDVTTALMVVNELGVIISAVCAQKGSGHGWRIRERQGLVLVRPAFGLAPLLRDAFAEIPPAAREHPRVIARVLEVLAEVARKSREPELLQELKRTGAAVLEAVEDARIDAWDQRVIDERWISLRTAVEMVPEVLKPEEIH